VAKASGNERDLVEHGPERDVQLLDRHRGHHDELVAAGAGHNRPRVCAKAGLHELADRSKRVIACRVAMRVIDAFEAIEVEHARPHAAPFSHPVAEFAFDCSSVCESRQRIGHGRGAQAAAEFGL
jgi:hypothetical protein